MAGMNITAQELQLIIEATAAELNLASNFGAYLICTCLGCMLFGLTAHQTFRYFRLYPGDIWGMKAVVLLVLSLDLTHTVTCIHIVYFYLVSNYFHPQRLVYGVWSVRLVVAEMGFMMFIVHSFYARRLFLLGGRNPFPVLAISVFLFAELGLCIAASVESFMSVTFEKFQHFTWLVWSILSIAVLVDVLSTAILMYYLSKNKTGFKRTDSTVDILMVYGVNTGLSTSIVAIIALICGVVMPKNLIYSAVLVVTTKMYANSLLAVLNSRRSIIDKGMEGFDTAGSFGLKVLNARDADRRYTREIAFRTRPPTELLSGPTRSDVDLKAPESYIPDDERAHLDRARGAPHERTRSVGFATSTTGSTGSVVGERFGASSPSW